MSNINKFDSVHENKKQIFYQIYNSTILFSVFSDRYNGMKKKSYFYQVYKSAIILSVAFQAGAVELKNLFLWNLIIQQQYLQVVIHTRTVMV